MPNCPSRQKGTRERKTEKYARQKGCPDTVNLPKAQPFTLVSCIHQFVWGVGGGRIGKAYPESISQRKYFLRNNGRENNNPACPQTSLFFLLPNHQTSPSFPSFPRTRPRRPPLSPPPCPVLSFRLDSPFSAPVAGRSRWALAGPGSRGRAAGRWDGRLIPAGDPAAWALLALRSRLQFTSLSLQDTQELSQVQSHVAVSS